MRFVAFKPEHMMQMKPHLFQKKTGEHLNWAQANALAKGQGHTLLNDADEPIFCGGLVEIWPSRAVAWAYFTDEGVKKLKHPLRLINKVLAECPYSRVEATVPSDDPVGHRWLSALGFECEAQCMRKFWPDGGDESLYAKVK